MHFDDRLDTILKLPTDSPSTKAAIWGQLTLVLAQMSGTLPADQEAKARALENTLRADVPLDRRKFVAKSLASRIGDIETLLIFGQDSPPVAAEILRNANLSYTEWVEVIPRLPPASRALLRERLDIPESVTRMLSVYGTGNAALPSSNISEKVESDNTSPTQIRDLVARIEAYKNERGANLAAHIFADSTQNFKAVSFKFETDRAGIICWVQGAPRGAVIGISFAEISEPRAFGVDGHAAGAFRKRSPFHKARLRVAGTGAASGDWLISADPSFDTDDGRFCGYRGIARRAEPGEQINAFTPFGKDMSADAIRQLAHELRSPLNAIRGFAEMIDGQLLGPVSQAYRHQARKVVEDSIRLVNIVNDVDLIAQLEMDSSTLASNDVSDVVEMVETVLHRLDEQIAHYGINLTFLICTNLPCCAIDRPSGVRLIERMIATTIGIAETGEALAIEVTHHTSHIIITIDRPRLIDFDLSANLSVLSADQELRCANPPALGLNFAIRLIQQMAQAVGGQFKIEARKFTLIMPQARDSEKKTIESG